MTNINSKVVENQKKVMNNKIVQGLNLLNSQENGLTKTYANSEEFVRALSKYMKMTTICGAGNLKDCFAYDKVNYDKDGEVKSVELSSITSASKLKLSDDYLPPAGFVMGDGTPVIVAWNSKCASDIVLDPDQPLKGIPTSCFDGLYDNSGTRNPNMYGKDVLPFGVAKIGTSYPGVEIPGIGYIYLPNGDAEMTADQALARGSEEIKIWDKEWDEATGVSGPSYWGGARKLCEDQGMSLPTPDELKDLYMLKSQYPDVIPQSGNYWSSSTVTTGAKAVFFGRNGGIPSYSSKSVKFYHVLCIGK